jgi:hypothetical protein
MRVKFVSFLAAVALLVTAGIAGVTDPIRLTDGRPVKFITDTVGTQSLIKSPILVSGSTVCSLRPLLSANPTSPDAKRIHDWLRRLAFLSLRRH